MEKLVNDNAVYARVLLIVVALGFIGEGVLFAVGASGDYAGVSLGASVLCGLAIATWWTRTRARAARVTKGWHGHTTRLAPAAWRAHARSSLARSRA